MGGTVYRRLNAYINKAALTAANANQEIGVTIYKFLKRLEVAGYCTEVARNSGPGPAANTGSNFHDQASPFLQPAWARFTWHASPLRPYAHTLFIAWGLNPFNSGVNSPGLIRNVSNNSTLGFGMQVVSLFDTGTLTSLDPWNNVTPTTKGDPVWKTPGVGEELRILPLSNNPGGTHATSRQNVTGVQSSLAFSTNMYIQMFADQDNLLIAFSRDATVQRNLLWMGTYIPHSGITAPFPIFLLDADSSAQVVPDDANPFGTLTTGIGTHEGGVMHSASHAGVFQANTNFLTAPGFGPNANMTGTKYPSQRILVGKDGAGELGIADPSFLKAIHGSAPVGTLSDLGTIMPIGGTSGTRIRFGAPWDGVSTFQTGTNREGVDS